MTERKKWLYIASLLILGLTAGFVICFFVINGLSVTGGTSGKAVAKKAEFVTMHTLCGHESTYTENSDTQAAFSSEEDIREAFPEWTLLSVSDEKIVLKKQVANYCPNHFFAYLDNKKIYIETLNGDKKDVLNVAGFKFTEEEEKTLKEGVYLNGKEMYTSFIEDFTS